MFIQRETCFTQCTELSKLFIQIVPEVGKHIIEIGLEEFIVIKNYHKHPNYYNFFLLLGQSVRISNL